MLKILCGLYFIFPPCTHLFKERVGHCLCFSCFCFALLALRGFAYITYFLEEHAERAASVLNGFKFYGSAMKTKGPSVLREEGHIPRSPRSSQQDNLDYRRYTDCSFFVQGNLCRKGKSVSLTWTDRDCNIMKGKGWLGERMGEFFHIACQCTTSWMCVGIQLTGPFRV